MNACRTCEARCAESPTNMRSYQADGLAIVMLELARPGMTIAQHSHSYEHPTMIANGSVRLHGPDGDQDFTAPHVVIIAAHALHKFTALSADVRLLCIHNTARTGQIETAEYATLGEL